MHVHSSQMFCSRINVCLEVWPFLLLHCCIFHLFFKSIILHSLPRWNITLQRCQTCSPRSCVVGPVRFMEGPRIQVGVSRSKADCSNSVHTAPLVLGSSSGGRAIAVLTPTAAAHPVVQIHRSSLTLLLQSVRTRRNMKAAAPPTTPRSQLLGYPRTQPAPLCKRGRSDVALTAFFPEHHRN